MQFTAKIRSEEIDSQAKAKTKIFDYDLYNFESFKMSSYL